MVGTRMRKAIGRRGEQIMHGQRQKKRNAQFRKKHFDAKNRDQSGRGRKGQTVDAPGQKTVDVPGQNMGHQWQRTSGEKPPDRKEYDSSHQPHKEPEDSKYSRREVTSNWDRYEDGELMSMCPTTCSETAISSAVEDTAAATYTAETEEEQQMRLVQLLNLPTPAPQDPIWTPGGEEEWKGEKGSHLTLNVAELAESLTSLPIWTRLDLSSDLLQHYGVSESDFDESTSARQEPDESTSARQEPDESTSARQEPDEPSNHSGLPSAGPHTRPVRPLPSSTASGSSIYLESLLSRDNKHSFDFTVPKKTSEDKSLLSTMTPSKSDDHVLEALLQTRGHTAPHLSVSHPSTPPEHTSPLHTSTQPSTPPDHTSPLHTSTQPSTPPDHTSPLHTSTHSSTPPDHMSLSPAPNPTSDHPLPPIVDLDNMLDDLLA